MRLSCLFSRLVSPITHASFCHGHLKNMDFPFLHLGNFFNSFYRSTGERLALAFQFLFSLHFAPFSAIVSGFVPLCLSALFPFRTIMLSVSTMES
jgi:hypothetical protein